MNFYIKIFYHFNEVQRGQQTYIVEQESRKCVILKSRRSGHLAKFTLGEVEKFELAKWKLGEVVTWRRSNLAKVIGAAFLRNTFGHLSLRACVAKTEMRGHRIDVASARSLVERSQHGDHIGPIIRSCNVFYCNIFEYIHV